MKQQVTTQLTQPWFPYRLTGAIIALGKGV